jgi:hypothetical protein
MSHPENSGYRQDDRAAPDDTYLYYGGYGAEGVWRAKLDGTDRQQIVRSMFPAWAICLSKR